jgi:hypothetical protein
MVQQSGSPGRGIERAKQLIGDDDTAAAVDQRAGT